MENKFNEYYRVCKKLVLSPNVLDGYNSVAIALKY